MTGDRPTHPRGQRYELSDRMLIGSIGMLVILHLTTFAVMVWEALQ